jgi:hypothetical protein
MQQKDALWVEFKTRNDLWNSGKHVHRPRALERGSVLLSTPEFSVAGTCYTKQICKRDILHVFSEKSRQQWQLAPCDPVAIYNCVTKFRQWQQRMGPIWHKGRVRCAPELKRHRIRNGRAFGQNGNYSLIPALHRTHCQTAVELAGQTPIRAKMEIRRTLTSRVWEKAYTHASG